jgi:isoamylase
MPGSSSVVADPSAYDWEGDEPLHRPLSRPIIYEMHVNGFTRHPTSEVAKAKRGTYARPGRQDSKDLGITAVELLPVLVFSVTGWGLWIRSKCREWPGANNRGDP